MQVWHLKHDRLLLAITDISIYVTIINVILFYLMAESDGSIWLSDTLHNSTPYIGAMLGVRYLLLYGYRKLAATLAYLLILSVLLVFHYLYPASVGIGYAFYFLPMLLASAVFRPPLAFALHLLVVVAMLGVVAANPHTALLARPTFGALSFLGFFSLLITAATLALRQSAEERIAEIQMREEQLRAVLQSVDDHVRLFDADGHLDESLQQRTPDMRWLDQPDYIARFRESFEQVRAARRTLRLEVLYESGEQPHWYDIKISPRYDKHGTFQGVTVVSRSIQEQKETLAALEDARSKAEAASSARGRFLAQMSHELRTPLNAIMGFAEVIEQADEVPATYQRHARIVQTSGAHLLSVINDTLEVSRAGSGKMRLKMHPVALRPLIERVHDLFSLNAQKKGLDYSLHLSPDLPEFIYTDPAKLQDILQNLLSNAIKYTSQGSVQVFAARQRGNAGEAPQLVLTVKDTGMGIAQDDYERLFTPFERIPRDITPPGSTGLGLAIVQGYVDLFGGTIAVDSAVGEGSTFTVTIHYEPATQDLVSEATPIVPMDPAPDAPPDDVSQPAVDTLHWLGWMHALPPDVRAGLRAAITEASLTRARALLPQIRAENRAFADELQTLVEDYRFHELYEILVTDEETH